MPKSCLARRIERKSNTRHSAKWRLWGLSLQLRTLIRGQPLVAVFLFYRHYSVDIDSCQWHTMPGQHGPDVCSFIFQSLPTRGLRRFPEPFRVFSYVCLPESFQLKSIFVNIICILSPTRVWLRAQKRELHFTDWPANATPSYFLWRLGTDSDNLEFRSQWFPTSSWRLGTDQGYLKFRSQWFPASTWRLGTEAP